MKFRYRNQILRSELLTVSDKWRNEVLKQVFFKSVHGVILLGIGGFGPLIRILREKSVPEPDSEL